MTELTDHLVDGRVPVRDYRPAGPETGPAVLWLHGGGFSGGGLDQKESDAPARALAKAGHRVRTVDYRLVSPPRPWGRREPHPNRYPAALHDVLDAARSLVEATGGRIVLGGASAGATLAASAALTFTDAVGLILAYGGFHAVLPENAAIERELGLARWLMRPALLHRIAVNYVGSEDLEPAFPGGKDLRGLPRTLVLDARDDRLRRSGHAFAEELRAGGVDVTEHVVPAGHAFLDRPRGKGFHHGIRVMTDWLAYSA